LVLVGALAFVGGVLIWLSSRITVVREIISKIIPERLLPTPIPAATAEYMHLGNANVDVHQGEDLLSDDSLEEDADILEVGIDDKKETGNKTTDEHEKKMKHKNKLMMISIPE